ncbi:MAG: dihydroneopterin aldolase [Deltaproteobacteria bacterium]|nr:dihydroneopterin aldolase [Deltaproteobacteria bacterium]
MNGDDDTIDEPGPRTTKSEIGADDTKGDDAPRGRRRPDVIEIRDLRVECIVGVYPHERDTPQPLQIDVRLELEPVLEVHRLRQTVDYAAIASQIAFVLQSCRFFLLETAATTLARLLLAPPALGEDRAPIQAARVRLVKPLALGGVGVPSLEIHREAADVTLAREDKPFGTVDIVHETREVGVYRLNIAPGRGIPLHVHRVMQESEMVLGDNLLLNGEPVAAGSVHRWPHDLAHRYDNPSDRWASILCVDSPRFIPDDEVEVSGEPGRADAEPPFIRRHVVVGA